MIYHVVSRVASVPSIDHVVVATSTLAGDLPLVNYLRSIDVPVFCGSEQDVLARYYGAACEFEADVIVRITADCPLISRNVTEYVTSTFLSANGAFDYVSNTLSRTYPRGLDTEVFSFAALTMAHRRATAPSDREHVTPFIWRQPDVFRLKSVTSEIDNSTLRWTVDEEADFELVQRIYSALLNTNPDFEYEEILRLLGENPDWTEINRHVEQKYV